MKRCKKCGKKGHSRLNCPTSDPGDGTPSIQRALSSIAWVPQTAGSDEWRHRSKEETKGDGEDDMMDSDDSDAQDVLKPTDYVFMCGMTNMVKEDFRLETVVYDDERDHIFVRNDIPLGRSVLDLTWMDFTPSVERGNLAVVSSLLPIIEIYDIESRDIRPVGTLGGVEDDDMPIGDVSPEELRRNLTPGSHTEPVLCTDWNIHQRNLLASASADKTVKVWDLEKLECGQTLKVHDSEVLHVAWSPQDRFTLLSAGLNDRKVVLSRLNQESAGMTFDVGCSPLSVVWHPHQPTMFVVGTNMGSVKLYDSRMNAGPMAEFKAHPDAKVTAIAPNYHIAGLLATGSDDNTIALWDLRTAEPKEIRRESLGVGEVFALAFSPNNPTLLAGGGSTAQHLIWSVTDAVQHCGFSIPG